MGVLCLCGRKQIRDIREKEYFFPILLPPWAVVLPGLFTRPYTKQQTVQKKAVPVDDRYGWVKVKGGMRDQNSNRAPNWRRRGELAIPVILPLEAFGNPQQG